MLGKKTSLAPSRAGTVGVLLTIGATEQQAEHRLLVNALFLMVSRTGRRAQHRRRYRAPDGEQDGKQYQEPDTKRFHRDQISTVTVHECRQRV